jgi:hypothetical protein
MIKREGKIKREWREEGKEKERIQFGSDHIIYFFFNLKNVIFHVGPHMKIPHP